MTPGSGWSSRTEQTREAVFGLMAASLSASGYALARKLMRINGFLGDLVGLPGS